MALYMVKSIHDQKKGWGKACCSMGKEKKKSLHSMADITLQALPLMPALKSLEDSELSVPLNHSFLRLQISKLIFAPARKRPFPFWTKQTSIEWQTAH